MIESLSLLLVCLSLFRALRIADRRAQGLAGGTGTHGLATAAAAGKRNRRCLRWSRHRPQRPRPRHPGTAAVRLLGF